MKIVLDTVNDVGLFVARCGEFHNDIDYSYGRYTVDAKSFMGVFSIGLGHDCDVEIHTNDEKVRNKFNDAMILWKRGN